MNRTSLAALALALTSLSAAPVAAQQPGTPPDSPVPDPAAKTPPTEDKALSQGKGPAVTPPTAPRTAPPQDNARAVDRSKWDVNAPPGMVTREVPLDVTEGTWMNVDVSPDGRTLAFDLMGDIYTMPVAGGTPTRIASGLAWEHQPRFSPDGRRIAFVSDRAGGDNVWVMNADGSDKRQVTKEDFRLTNQPSWSPDGRFIVAKKHFTTERSLGTGEVWMYHVSGGGGVQLVKRASERLQKELGEPIFAPDGKGVYYTRNVTPGPVFEYAQNSHTDLFDIERYDVETGEVSKVVTGAGGAVRPTPSRNGKSLAFVRREHGKTTLWVKDLTSGAERKVYDNLDRDVQETWAVTGVYPNMAWTPDDSALVFWAGGKLHRVALNGGADAVIPFRVADTRVVIDAPHPQIAVAPDRFTTTMPRWAAVSPDGRQVVYETLGKLWLKPMAGGAARRLVKGDEAGMELWPSWSRDGRNVVFVGWTDAGLGQVRVVSAGGGAARVVTKVAGHYARPKFSPDGGTIVFEQREGGYLTAARGGDRAGIWKVATSGGTAERLPVDGEKPQFGADGKRLFFVASEGGKRQLVSTDLGGGNKRVHAAGELVNDYAVSPDGRMVAFRQNYQAFVMPLMPGGQNVDVDKKGSALPVTAASTSGADFIHFTNNGEELHWSIGPNVETVRTDAVFASAPPAPGADKSAKSAPLPTSRVSLAMEEQAAKPTGTVALTGARVVTMADAAGGIIDDATILIRGDRIVSVGPRGSVAIPAGAKTIDLAGKTVVPGFVDAHAHGAQAEDELIPQQNWSAIVNLAMGTTTIHDPSARPAEIFPASEMQRAGLILAPRTFSTGEIIYGAKSPDVYAEINSYDDALNHVRRLKAQGAHSVKNYNQPRREQRQMVVAAAAAENMEVVPEGGSLYTMDMTLVQDGNSTVEHNVPAEHFYADMIQLWSQTKTNYTPTLVVTYGGPAGDPYWRAHTDVWKHPILSRHEPTALLEAQNVRREIAPEEDYVDAASAREARKLMEKGVQVSIGAHGQQAGLGAHWEMWSFVRGGWSPIEALRAATIMPATSLGYSRDIGSLEPGKLADLVVLDADPTQDIRNTDKIHGVMLGGRMYDPLTMNETGTGTRVRAPYWWEGASGNGGVGGKVTSTMDTD